MPKKTPTSRHGLAACSSCGVHVETEGPCPFCGAGLSASKSGALATLVSRGRSGLIAASLLGLGATAGCIEPGDSPSPGGDAQADVQRDAGGDAPQDHGVDSAADFIPQPPYGIPPEPDATSDAGPTDASPQPMYGLPPEGF